MPVCDIPETIADRNQGGPAMAESTRLQSFAWLTSIAVGAGLLASLPADGTGQEVACDARLTGTLALPEIRISAAKAPLRVSPEPDARTVVSLPPDIEVALLDRMDEWYVVGYRDGDRNRRLYVAARDAEGPAAASLDPRQVRAQEWATAHTLACERIAGEKRAARSLAAAGAFAGLTSIIWHKYIDDDDYYGTGFAVWSGISVGSFVGAVYKAFGLRSARKALRDLGPPSATADGTDSRVVRLEADLRFDMGMNRLALVAAWRP